MPFLALTRSGISSFVEINVKSSGLWIGSDVLSNKEVQMLRAMQIQVSIFIHPIRSEDEVLDAIPTLREHHPNEPVWIEAIPERFNLGSSDFVQAFLWREFIVGVNYQHNDYVTVERGPHQGERGSLVALVDLEPEPLFVLEAESSHDIEVAQSMLKLADA